MISHEHRCIFIHIPKTGGTSLENLIWPAEQHDEAHLARGFVDEFHNRYQTGSLKHLLARQVRHAVGAAVFEGCFKFAFVRNPWDRAVSQYAYMATRPDLRRFAGLPDGACFKTWLDRTARRRHVQWEPQIHFLVDEEGQSLVDAIGRFENFDADARRMLAAIGLPHGPLRHDNASERAAYPHYYDAESREIVAERYAADIAAFNYRFEAAAMALAA